MRDEPRRRGAAGPLVGLLVGLGLVTAAPGRAAAQDLPAAGQATATMTTCKGPDGTAVGWAQPAPDLPDGCRAVSVPVAREAVLWTGWLPGLPGPGQSLALEGTGLGPAFKPGFVRLVEPDPRPSRPASLPVGEPLLPGLSAAPFGVEERVTVERTDRGVALSCRPGGKPAGLVLDPGDRRLPEGAELALAGSAEGADGFTAGVAAPGQAPASAAPIGTPARLTPGALPGAVRFVVACPPDGGRLTISDLRLVPAAPRAVEGRAAWAWRPELWRSDPEGLIGRARDAGIERLFVAVEVADGALQDPGRLEAFVALARRRRVDVVAVEGDPGMATQVGRKNALARLGALAAYQARAPAEARLAGLQYDIEPYLLPAYRSDPAGVMRGWAATVDALKAASPLDLDMVLPFWLRDAPEAEATVLPALRRSASAITVMAYRTRDDAVQAAAEPLLAWGAEAGIPVRVALEAGPLDDEETRIYRPAPEGELWLLPGDGGAAAVLLDRARPNPAGPAFSLDRRSEAPASRVSHLGDEARLLAAARRLQESLAAWPSFSGVALHGLIE